MFKNFQEHRNIFKDKKMFFKNQGQNAFWEKIQGQFLALKDVWQPYIRTFETYDGQIAMKIIVPPSVQHKHGIIW